MADAIVTGITGTGTVTMYPNTTTLAHEKEPVTYKAHIPEGAFLDVPAKTVIRIACPNNKIVDLWGELRAHPFRHPTTNTDTSQIDVRDSTRPFSEIVANPSTGGPPGGPQMPSDDDTGSGSGFTITIPSGRPEVVKTIIQILKDGMRNNPTLGPDISPIIERLDQQFNILKDGLKNNPTLGPNISPIIERLDQQFNQGNISLSNELRDELDRLDNPSDNFPRR